MKKLMMFWMVALIALFQFAAGCKEDDENPSSARARTYTLGELSGSGVSGSVTFTKVDAATTRVAIALTGTSEGNTHPAHIHSGNASTGGPIVLDLNPVDGATGKSETMVTALNNGTAIVYEDLIAFDGHVNVHKSATELGVMIAQGNIGSNVSTPAPSPDTGGGNGGY
ncbi:MAG TPA: CHRD domain-containing protein [Chryseosolibacter sp.]